MNLRFKTRIALFNTLAVAVITVFVFVAIYEVVNKTSFKHLDDDIVLEKDEVFNNLDWHQDSILIHKLPEWDEAEHNKVEVNPTFLQIVDTKGNVVFHSTNLLKNHFLFNPHIEEEKFYNSEINQQKIRLGQFPIRNNSGKIIGQLTIAISQQESYSIMQNLLWVLLLTFPLVLVAQFLASSLAAAKGIQPVLDLIRTASGISDSNIETRLVLPERKDELYDLTKTINELLARIDLSMHQQKQFTSDASHEIRTPLAAIRGMLEVLVRKPREPKVYEEKIADIITQVDRLNDLLDQLLQLARIESGVAIAKKEKVSLVQVTTSLLDKWKEMASAKRITIGIAIPDDVILNSDKIFLELILNNLVSNAIKYGKENGQVLLKWNSSGKTLTVQDDGIGISNEDLAHIYNRFYRADSSRSSTVKGSGLGLSIVKKLCHLLNITLNAESSPQAGSAFTLKFPQ
jgi:signal transduction histidine kinase